MSERAASAEGLPGGPPAEGWSHRPPAHVEAFPRTTWGHRGYEEAPVDAFLGQVEKDRTSADQEIADLRSEVDRLHRYIRRQWAAVAAAEAAGARSKDRSSDHDCGGPVSPAAQARAVLSQAQEIADRRLRQADERLAQAQQLAADRVRQADQELATRLAEADETVSSRIAAADEAAAQRLSRVDGMAEQVLSEARKDAASHRAKAVQDSNRLLQHARNQYEEIVIRAHRRADRAAEVALYEFEQSATDDTGRARAELELKAAYLRTFAKVSRAALQAALDVTAREFDRLLGASATVERSLALASGGPVKSLTTPSRAARSSGPSSEPSNEKSRPDAAQDVPAPTAPPVPARSARAVAQAAAAAARAAGKPTARVITMPDTQAGLGKLRSVIRVGSSPLDPTAN
jgi:hypothetical protein